MGRSIFWMFLFQLPEITFNSCNFGGGITLLCVSLRLHCTWGRETLWTMWIQWKQLVGETVHFTFWPNYFCESCWFFFLSRWGNKSGPFWSSWKKRYSYSIPCVQTAVLWKHICPFDLFFAYLSHHWCGGFKTFLPRLGQILHCSCFCQEWHNHLLA